MLDSIVIKRCSKAILAFGRAVHMDEPAAVLKQ